MSKSVLYRKFNKAVGESPLNYLNIIRIRKATKEIKINPNLSITEIAFQVGFSDSNYFARVFRKHLGMSASEYRKQFQ